MRKQELNKERSLLYKLPVDKRLITQRLLITATHNVSWSKIDGSTRVDTRMLQTDEVSTVNERKRIVKQQPALTPVPDLFRGMSVADRSRDVPWDGRQTWLLCLLDLLDHLSTSASAIITRHTRLEWKSSWLPMALYCSRFGMILRISRYPSWFFPCEVESIFNIFNNYKARLVGLLDHPHPPLLLCYIDYFI